ncbi:Uncharacterized protein Adt_24507 [Abeliophyllum distichum]|uniref:Reverse transcriptase domain-containing protein n=1 Tax=Abeliophyllum distichum TaxID=126358 RepID=A0ABD1SDX8_9LAMI
MAKAYDRLDWDFLMTVLERFGFDWMWRDMIKRCISECHFSVLVNGRPCGFFPSSRGLRQRDPISSSLFIIAADYFSRCLTQAFQQYPSMAYIHRSDTLVSHLCFANDMIIFANGQKQDKSGFIVPKKSPPSRIQILEHITGFKHWQQPFTYLGIPLFKGVRKTFLYDDLLQKIKSRISGWTFRLLSSSGKITLLRLTVCIGGDGKIFAFLLMRVVLGFRRLEDVVQAFSLKLWWLFRSQQSLWTQFLLGKYCRSNHPILAPIPHSASTVWRWLKGVGLIAEPHIAWQLGHGRIFFWHDCWMGNMTLAQMFAHREHTSVQVVEFFDDTGWDIDRLLLVLPHYMAVQVESLPLCLDVLNRLVGFLPSLLAACSHWEYSSGILWYDLVPNHPADYLFLLLAIVAWFSASGCDYSEEDSRPHGITDWHGAQSHHLPGPSHYFFAAYGQTLSDCALAWGPLPCTTFWYYSYFSYSQPPTLVYWRVPSVGSTKINTDGCIRDGFASDGGIIRYHTGHCIRAFSASYGDIFILEAELRAILQGIELARRMGLVDLWIETDSTLAVHCISRGGGSWVIQSMLRRIRHLLSFDRDTVSHIFREENQVADSLAFEGWD